MHTIDKRIQRLSYSSLLTLHSCPRKFELQKLSSQVSVEDTDEESITFAFGHLVGEGIQLLLQNFTYEETVFKLFCQWKLHLFAENTKQNKSFFTALFALRQFLAIKNTLLGDYELVHYNDKPAVELGFRIHFPDGFTYRGYVDSVLQHKVTGEILVLEIKTSSARTMEEVQYKNSAQAIGYSIVLDHIFPELSSYEVLYLPYLTKSMEYQPMRFKKSFLQRALWLQELLLDIETIKLYANAGVYPMHGESCYDYYRECKYYGICTMATDRIAPTVEQNTIPDEEPYSIEVSFMDLVHTQLEKTA